MLTATLALAALLGSTTAHCKSSHPGTSTGFANCIRRHIPVARVQGRDNRPLGECSSNEQLQYVGAGMWDICWSSSSPSLYTQVTDVTSEDLRCYTSETDATATTLTVAAGDELSFHVNDALTIYHQGVVNVYMAQVPSGSDAASFAGDGDIWFKVFEIPAVTDGGTSISFPAQNVPSVNFTLPAALPSGQYLVRMEAIALHVASTFGGAQFYVSFARHHQPDKG